MNSIEKLNDYYVYMHINRISEKKYIGITHTTLHKRWGNNGSGYKNGHQSVFGRAIDKYGWDNFDHIILFQNLTRDEACEKEIECIKKYNTQNPNFGYNIQPGGQLGNAGIKFSEESKQKMSNAKRGKKLSEEHKRKISESCKGHKPGAHTEDGLRRLREFNTGKTLSEETRRKISQSLRGIKRSQETLRKRKENSSRNIPVYCPELNMIFDTICDAANYTNAQRSNIQKCLKGERKTAGFDPASRKRLHWERLKK